ncbi:MAG TPA: hypothetical protein VGO16_02545, partial [Pseudonocardiaceae bacterium]|nr:hypothetical protein [Pseudonocardiaceae bacterium]
NRAPRPGRSQGRQIVLASTNRKGLLGTVQAHSGAWYSREHITNTPRKLKDIFAIFAAVPCTCPAGRS